MVAKIFGGLFIVAGIGNFIGVFSGAADPADIIYGAGFIAFGVFLFSIGQNKKQNNQESFEN